MLKEQFSNFYAVAVSSNDKRCLIVITLCFKISIMLRVQFSSFCAIVAMSSHNRCLIVLILSWNLSIMLKEQFSNFCTVFVSNKVNRCVFEFLYHCQDYDEGALLLLAAMTRGVPLFLFFPSMSALC